MTTARDLLAEHMEIVERYKGLPLLATRERKELLKRLNSQVPRLNHILRELGPDFGQLEGKFYGDHVRSILQIERAIHLLDQMDGHEALHERPVPALPMTCLHLLAGHPCAAAVGGG